MNIKIIISAFLMLVVACATRPETHNASLSELSSEFRHALERNNVNLDINSEHISDYGMYILKVSGSKYFKDDAVISIDPEQIIEFDELSLKIKRAMERIDKHGGEPIQSISFSMAYQDKKSIQNRK